MKLNVLKCHGSGHDFLLIDELSNPCTFTEEERQNLALSLCDRQKGIGADGILFVLESKRCDAVMRVFNADGSEASMCGHGLRCVGRYVCELTGRDSIVIETMKADYLTKIQKRLSSIEQQKTCVQKAKNQEDLQACIWTHKAEMKNPRKDMSKTGSSMDSDRKMPSQTE